MNILILFSLGAGGLTSALRLRQKGYRDITVFERSAVPGGKAVTIKVENNAGVKDSPLYVAAVLGESMPRPCYRTAKLWYFERICRQALRGPQQQNGTTPPVVCASPSQQQANAHIYSRTRCTYDSVQQHSSSIGSHCCCAGHKCAVHRAVWRSRTATAQLLFLCTASSRRLPTQCVSTTG
jgi:hypothetical protein